MLFRFGWRKEKQKLQCITIGSEKEVESEMPEVVPLDDSAPFEPIIVNIQPDKPKARIVLLGDQEELSGLYRLYLRSKGYEVLHFNSPEKFDFIDEQRCICLPDHFCADIVIAQMEMEPMNGLEFFRFQNDKGCHLLSQNKAVIANRFTAEQEFEARSMGCRLMQKPFRIVDLMTWIQECEKRVSAKRKLNQLNESAKV